MEQRHSWLRPRRFQQRDCESGSIVNASAAALAAMAQRQPQTRGAAMAMAQQLQQWFQKDGEDEQFHNRNKQKGIA
jgi:hypothetical protein